MRWISWLLILVLLLGSGGYFYWQRLESSKVVYVFLPEVPSATITPWTAITPADRTVLYNTRRGLFKYGKTSTANSSWEKEAIPDLALSATSTDNIHWTISVKSDMVTASQIISTWSETLKRGDPTVVGKLFYYIEGGQSYKNDTGPFKGLSAETPSTLHVVTAFPLNLPLLLADPVFSASATTDITYENGVLLKGEMRIIFTNEPEKADIAWLEEGTDHFSGTFDYAVSSTVLPTVSTTSLCLNVPLADLSQVQILTPTVFYVPPQRPPEGKVSLYPWQLDYPSEEAFKLGLAVLLNDPTVASATQSLSELMDKNHIYVANPQCFNLKVHSRISGLETHLDILDFTEMTKKVW